MQGKLSTLLAGWGVACLLAGTTARAATLSLEQRVDALQKRATALAARQHWPAAIATLVQAEDALRAAERGPKRQVGTGNAAYQRDVRKLQAWSASRAREVKKGNGTFEEFDRDVRARKAELDRRYGIRPARAPAVALPDEHRQLLLASLEETIAGYAAKRGDTAAAVIHRREAGSLRIRLYQARKKPEQAAQAAEKLAQTNPEDAGSHELAAQCYQEQGGIDRATSEWRAAIRLLEQGKERRPANPNADPIRARAHRLSIDYRQLAFCLTRAGQAREASQAMEAARRADVQARIDLRKR